MSPLSRRVTAAAAFLLVGFAAREANAKTRTLAISGAACPAEADLLRALRDVLVDTAIDRVEQDADLTVVATDDEVAVTAEGTTKRFTGTCAERARLVSAYLALALEPPAVAEPTPPPPPLGSPALPPRGLPPAPPATPIEARVGVGVGALGTVGTAAHGGGVAPAFTLRGALGKGSFHGIVGIGASLPATLATRGPDVALSLLTFDAGLRVVVRVSERLSVGGEAGALVARATIEATGIPNPEPAASRAELGARLAALAELRVGERVSVATTFETDLLPGTATLALRRDGNVGEMPSAYLGASLAIVFRAR